MEERLPNQQNEINANTQGIQGNIIFVKSIRSNIDPSEEGLKDDSRFQASKRTITPMLTEKKSEIKIPDKIVANYYKLVVKGGNADQIDGETKQTFLNNFFQLDFEEVMRLKTKISYLEFRTVIFACFCIFSASAVFYSMSFMFNEPTFKCPDKATGNLRKCTEEMYCSDTQNNQIHWAYHSLFKQHDLVCGEDTLKRQHYKNVYLLFEAYTHVALIMLADVIGRRKLIIYMNIVIQLGYLQTIYSTEIWHNIFGYIMIGVGSNVSFTCSYFLIYETLLLYPKYKSYGGVMSYVSCSIQMILINVLTLQLKHWWELFYYMSVLAVVNAITIFFTKDSLIFLLKKGWISNFFEFLNKICVSDNTVELYDDITHKIDPMNIISSVKYAKVSKNIVFKEKIKKTLKRFCTFKEFIKIACLGYIQGILFMVFYLVVLSVNDVGLENPNYTGILLGISTGLVPFMASGLVKKTKRITLFKALFVSMIASTMLIEVVGRINPDSKMFMQLQSLIGAFLIKGIASITDSMLLVYTAENYESEFRSQAFSFQLCFSKVMVVMLPQYEYFVKDILRVNVLSGISVFYIIGIFVLGILPETYGTTIDLQKKNNDH